MSYVHPLASFLTPDTIRLGVKVGPDGNDRRTVCPVARILTEVPPTSTTSTFLAENVFATRVRVAFMLSPPASPLSRQRRTPFGLIAAAIATAPVVGGEQREFTSPPWPMLWAHRRAWSATNAPSFLRHGLL